MGLNRVCEDLLKSARFAFVKQDWSKAVNDLSELLNEVRDTESELDLVMAPVHILYAFCILRQIANRDENAEDKPEVPVIDIEKNKDERASSSSNMPGPSSSSGPAEEMEADDDDDLAELDEPAKSLMIAWEVLLLAKSIFERFPTKANKFEELRAIELQAEILFHNNDEQCLDYLDKIVEELKNFPFVLVWPLKVLTAKAAYLMRFKNYEKFAENLNIINGRLEDAMSEVQQPVGENFQKFFGQIKEDVKEMLAQEKAEIKASTKKDEENVLQLNAEEMRGKIESKLLTACSPYPLAEDEMGSKLSSRILDDVNEIISDGIEDEKKTSTKIIESEQIGFGSPSEEPSSATSSSLLVRRKPPAQPESPDKGKRRVLLTSISTNGNGTH